MKSTILEGTLENLLKGKKIEIPAMQRDYAQGRTDDGTNIVRKNFVDALWNVLTSEQNVNMNLDLIYGCEESEESPAFIPLDGQQRLTTLWLLHWFVASRTHHLAEIKSYIQNFSYEVREAPRAFMGELLDFECPATKQPSIEIKKQSWYYSDWDLDPTVCSMLVMIDHLAERGPCLDVFFERLRRFRFYMLDMDALGLSDDLYIKMNGRGLALTPFENFKAELTRHLPFNSEQVREFTLWLDHSFLEFFWSESDVAKKRLPDSLMMEFINRYAIVRKILVTETKAEEGGKIIEAFPAEYNSFTPYKFAIDWMLFRKVFSFMAEDREEQSWQPSWERSEGEYVLPSYRREERRTISTTGRCIFAAICIFVMKKPDDTCNSHLFKQWMRICWNVVENTSGMVSRIKLLKRLADKLLAENTSADLYRYIGEMIKENKLRPEDIVDGNASEQLRVLREEFIKAGKRSDTQSTEEERTKIDMADARFKGTIFFLFADGYNDTGFSCKWENFSKKWGKISEYIGEKTLGKDEEDRKKEGWVNFIYGFLHHIECDDDGNLRDLDTVFDYENEKSLLTDTRFLRMIDATLMDIPPAIEWGDKRWRWTDDEGVPRFAMLMSHTPLVKAIVSGCKKGRIQWHHDSWVIYAKNSRRDAEKILVGQYPAARCDTLSRIRNSVPNEKWITDDQGKAWYLWGFDTEFVLDNKTFVWSLNWWNHIRMKNSQGNGSPWIPHRYVPDKDIIVWVSGEAETIVGKFLEENEWESPYKFRERLFNEFKDELSKEFPDKAVNVWSTRGNKYAGKQELSSPGDAEEWLACGIEVEKGSQRGLACICSDGNVVEYGMRRHPEDDNINGNPDFWWWSKSVWSGNTASYGGNDICNTIKGINTTFFGTSGELLRDKVRKLVDRIAELIKPTPVGATDSAPSTSIQS